MWYKYILDVQRDICLYFILFRHTNFDAALDCPLVILEDKIVLNLYVQLRLEVVPYQLGSGPLDHTGGLEG
jgi:hypothetical protein